MLVVDLDPALPSAAHVLPLPTTSIISLEVHGSRRLLESMESGCWFGASSAWSSPVSGPRAFAVGDARWLLVDFEYASVQREVRLLPERAAVRLVDVSQRYESYLLAAPPSGRRAMSAPRLPTHYVCSSAAWAPAVLHCLATGRYALHVARDGLATSNCATRSATH